jgi:bifunctional non-homologous end joining protein LigD
MTTITCLKQTALHCNTGGSDKLYILQLHRIDTPGAAAEYVAQFYYGARGSSLSLAEKGRGLSESNADNEFAKQEKAKRRKGYNDYIIPSGGIPGMPAGSPAFGGPATAAAPAAPASAPKPIVGPSPMLAEVLEEERLEDLLKDPNWVCQKKFDGHRSPVSMRRSALVATNRKGEVKPLTTGAEALLKKPLAQPEFGDNLETQVDGEIMGEAYVVYDVLTLRDNDVRKMPYYERYAALELLLEGSPGLLAETAWSEEDKRAMVARARVEQWEGLIFRDITAGYENGRTSAVLKFKLWAMATCRVMTVNAKRSIQVAMRDVDGSEHFVGNVTVPPDMQIPEPDSLVEVRYLYATEGGILYQPTLWELREDKDDADFRKDLRQCPPEKRSTPVAVAA